MLTTQLSDENYINSLALHRKITQDLCGGAKHGIIWNKKERGEEARLTSFEVS